ncbi:hypothetical protein LTR01_009211 [Friedmanniomyces endolithicus]|nr:hypothetical protein LTR01_009211 [Friedmanniomyces endolithicus]
MSQDDEQLQWRIALLTDLLRSAKPDTFRAAPCLGYIKVPNTDNASRYGIVFEEPLIRGMEPKVATLQELLERAPHPSLSARIALCVVLARCIHSFHALNWLHKALRPENILFFSSTESANVSEPFLAGFELSRPSIMEQWSEKPGFDPSKDIYRHPNAQSSQVIVKYRKSCDIYSLGVLMIEVALWKRFKDVVRLEDFAETKPSTLREIQPWLLRLPLYTGFSVIPTEAGNCLQQVSSACGDSFRNIIERCLRMDATEKPEYSEEQEAAIALRVQRVTEEDIVKELERIASSV